jgi:hypothetical protein
LGDEDVTGAGLLTGHVCITIDAVYPRGVCGDDPSAPSEAVVVRGAVPGLIRARGRNLGGGLDEELSYVRVFETR